MFAKIRPVRDAAIVRCFRKIPVQILVFMVVCLWSFDLAHFTHRGLIIQVIFIFRSAAALDYADNTAHT
jgi:hypothetical protein